VIHPEAKIEKGVVLGKNVVIDKDVVIEEGVTVGNNVVIYPGVKIGENTRIFDNAVLGRPPLATGNIARKLKKEYPPLEIGRECVIGAGCVIYTGTKIGNEVLIGDLAAIREECEIGNRVVIGRCSVLNYNIIIKDRVRIMDTCHFGGDMLIEEDVFISPHVCSANDNYMGIFPDRERRGAIIRRGALIGTNVTLLAWIEIGEYAVIGAGSVVNKDIPPRKVAAGVPVRIIKDVPEEWLKHMEKK